MSISYLETGGKDTFVRPWFWIMWLLLGPVIGSIAVQWYIFVAVCGTSFFASYALTDTFFGRLV